MAAKREKLPTAVRNTVWVTHASMHYATSVCRCCFKEQITRSNFECGHVIAKAKGGSDKVDNLLPICSACNKSMGTMSIPDFQEKYGLGPTMRHPTDAKEEDDVTLEPPRIPTLAELGDSLTKRIDALIDYAYIKREEPKDKIDTTITGAWISLPSDILRYSNEALADPKTRASTQYGNIYHSFVYNSVSGIINSHHFPTRGLKGLALLRKSEFYRSVHDGLYIVENEIPAEDRKKVINVLDLLFDPDRKPKPEDSREHLQVLLAKSTLPLFTVWNDEKTKEVEDGMAELNEVLKEAKVQQPYYFRMQYTRFNMYVYNAQLTPEHMTKLIAKCDELCARIRKPLDEEKAVELPDEEAPEEGEQKDPEPCDEKDAADTTDEELPVLETDATKAYCASCKQEVAKYNTKRHLSSAKHKANAKK
ncbi:MAG: HNH endonuclease [Patescibacteria group bacterium]|nr:HNH endonuclease [Patescibacteria group bacterium]